MTWQLAFKRKNLLDGHILPSMKLKVFLAFIVQRKTNFLFRFSIDNDWNLSARRSKLIDFKAEYPWHSDQLGYVFRFSGYPNLLPDTAYTNLTENSDQFQIIKNLSKFYMDFAKYGWVKLKSLFFVKLEKNVFILETHCPRKSQFCSGHQHQNLSNILILPTMDLS